MADEAALEQDRLDRWLWHARFFRTRSLAAKVVAGGKVRVNGQRTAKPARTVGPGDVLTFPQGKLIRVVRIQAIAKRRGPASEAALLFGEISASSGPKSGPALD